MTSTRLPGKVLAEIDGSPAILLLLERLRRASELDAILVATSVERSDDPLAGCVDAQGFAVFRGPLEDVLHRYRLAAEAVGCDAVVRITGDCPLIDPLEVDRAVARWREGGADFVANCFEPRTYPPGTDTEVLSWPALATSDEEADDDEEREHVTPFVRRRGERFRLVRLDLDPPAGGVRLVLDTQSDLRRLRRIVAIAGRDAGLPALLAAAEAVSSPVRRGGSR